MKKFVVGLVVAFLIIVIFGVIGSLTHNQPQPSSPSIASHAQNRTDTVSQSKQIQDGLTIDRTWAENIGGYKCSYAMVTWENKTDRTFTKAVTIQAIAYDEAGNKINTNQRSLFAHEHGPMPPGFTRTLKIPVELGDKKFAKMACSIVRAQ